MSKVRDILGPDRDSEFLLSFARVGIQAEIENDEPKSVYMIQKTDLTKQMSDGKSESSDKTPRKSKLTLGAEITKKSKRRGTYFDEIYTDKDRAAAVSIGSYDIKQSLHLKRRQDRQEALQLPEEAEPGSLITLGMREFKNGNFFNSIRFISKALELNPNDQNALVARSKCYLLLGEPAKGLQDAETALAVEKDNIRAIYQKAEALYFMGQFEHSLMFFYRGLRLRPELNSFRLGIQKTQEAIEKTIGGFPKKPSQRSSSSSTNVKQLSSSTSTQTKHIAEVVTTIQKNEPKLINNIKLPSTKVNGVSGGGGGGGGDNHKTIRPKTSIRISAEKREARKLLGELCVDKEYLENLLKHPDLKRADTGSENISILAKEAVNFLNNRQEFWRQQRPCTALPKKMQLTNTGGSVATGDSTMPKWF